MSSPPSLPRPGVDFERTKTPPPTTTTAHNHESTTTTTPTGSDSDIHFLRMRTITPTPLNLSPRSQSQTTDEWEQVPRPPLPHGRPASSEHAQRQPPQQPPTNPSSFLLRTLFERQRAHAIHSHATLTGPGAPHTHDCMHSAHIARTTGDGDGGEYVYVYLLPGSVYCIRDEENAHALHEEAMRSSVNTNTSARYRSISPRSTAGIDGFEKEKFWDRDLGEDPAMGVVPPAPPPPPPQIPSNTDGDGERNKTPTTSTSTAGEYGDAARPLGAHLSPLASPTPPPSLPLPLLPPFSAITGTTTTTTTIAPWNRHPNPRNIPPVSRHRHGDTDTMLSNLNSNLVDPEVGGISQPKPTFKSRSRSRGNTNNHLDLDLPSLDAATATSKGKSKPQPHSQDSDAPQAPKPAAIDIDPTHTQENYTRNARDRYKKCGKHYCGECYLRTRVGGGCESRRGLSTDTPGGGDCDPHRERERGEGKEEEKEKEIGKGKEQKRGGGGGGGGSDANTTVAALSQNLRTLLVASHETQLSLIVSIEELSGALNGGGGGGGGGGGKGKEREREREVGGDSTGGGGGGTAYSSGSRGYGDSHSHSQAQHPHPHPRPNPTPSASASASDDIDAHAPQHLPTSTSSPPAPAASRSRSTSTSTNTDPQPQPQNQNQNQNQNPTQANIQNQLDHLSDRIQTLEIMFLTKWGEMESRVRGLEGLERRVGRLEVEKEEGGGGGV
ncbi:hypothetical protein DFH27DRAFT_656416 [Peziza echinospora]|nr:hypothetical protein DFH27DRAFT_656416 [Peziza echinospora]